MMHENRNTKNAFDRIARAVADDPLDVDALDRYYRFAIGGNEIDRAIDALSQLQARQPWNHQLRKIYIALCLHKKDYPGAMQAIETLIAFSTPDDAMIDSALAVRKRVGPHSLANRSRTGASISLCMIVRNEQDFLGPCLNSIKSLVDEMIVIDTGSKDRSADLSRIFGASVYDFKWCDDFSAARNRSLEKASGDWILVLDADEIIAPQDHAFLRQMVTDGFEPPTAFAFETRNYTNQANAMAWQANDKRYPQQEACHGWFATKKVRLFPRSGGIRFRYPVHELVDPAVIAAGMQIADCPIPIHHYGHINERKNEQKAQYYFELGYTKLEQLGRDGTAIRELAVQAGQLGRWKEAIELWHRLLEIAPGFGEAYANIAGAHWQLGNYDEGLAFSHKTVRQCPELKEGHYNLAVNQLMGGQAREASAILKDLHERHPRYLAAEFMLGAALVLAGDLAQGRAVFKTVEEKITPTAFKIALTDLLDKMSVSGCVDDRQKLENAACIGEDQGCQFL